MNPEPASHPSGGPWKPPRPARGRLVLLSLLIVLTGLFILGARAAFNDGLTGDFPIYFRAADAILHGRSLQDAASQGYLGPPLCATLMAPLAALSQGAAAQVWTGISIALFGLMIWAAARDAADRWELPRSSFYTLAVAAATALLSFGQLRAEFRNGQVDGLLVAGFVFGLVFLERKPLLSGAAIGFAVNIKYTAIVLIPYLIVRRRFAAAASAVGWTIGFALLPALVSGWHRNLENLSISLAGILRLLGVDIGQRAVSNIPDLDYARSVSLTSAISRILVPSAGHAGTYAVLAVVAGLITAAAWLMYRRVDVPLLTRRGDRAPDRAITALEWSGVIIAVLLFSPQTQVRHMVILLPLHATVAAICMANPRQSRWLLAGGAIEQAGLNLPPGSMVTNETAEAWRAAAWPCWCLLCCYLCTLWSGLTTARRRIGAAA